MISKRGTPTPFDRVLDSGSNRRERTSFTNRVILPFIDRVIDPSSKFIQSMKPDEVRFKLMRAGFPKGLRAVDFIVIKLISPFIGALLFTAYGPLVSNALGWGGLWLSLAFMLVGALYGWKMPDIWLNSIIRRRQMEIQLALPDMIDLVTVSVEAGLGLDASLQRVALRFPNALSDEVLRSMQEVRLGRSRIEALRDMSKRVDVADLTAWVTALVQAELLGVSIANVLRVQSERLREKRSQRAREQAQKAPIKMVFPLVLFIFPALFIIILGPAALIAMDSGF